MVYVLIVVIDLFLLMVLNIGVEKLEILFVKSIFFVSLMLKINKLIFRLLMLNLNVDFCLNCGIIELWWIMGLAINWGKKVINR